MTEVEDLTGNDAGTVPNDLDNGEILPVTEEVNSVERDVRHGPSRLVIRGRGRPKSISGSGRGGNCAGGSRW